MAQKFTSLEEAAKLLGVSKDRLTQLREAGKVRGYRDGASWKFRAEDIEKCAEQGVPQLDPDASSLTLDLDDDAELPTPATSGLDLDLAEDTAASPVSGLDLDLAEDDELLPGPASDLNLDEIDEPTVPANIEADDDGLAIDLDSESIDLSDSILLSEAEIGSPSDRPPSTIIGKIELDPDGDLGISSTPTPKASSKPKPPSEIIAAELDDALDMDPPGPSASFEGLEELEVDLEAESSRILSPEDLAQAKSAAAAEKAAAAAKKAAEMSDLELAPTDSDPAIGASDIGLGGDAAKSGSLALTGLSALELDDDGDEVLGEGSDVTLSSESSGINIISPSDSGLALDEVDLSGVSAMGSSLDLGNLDDEEVSLDPLSIDAGASDAGAFQLTPLGEDGGDDEKDSSQVIALDDVSEEDTGGAILGSGFGAGDESLSEGFTDVGLATGVVAQPASDTPFSLFNVLSLSGCLLMLTLCGMMMFDLLRNMWSWGEVASFNSSLMDVLKF